MTPAAPGDSPEPDPDADPHDWEQTFDAIRHVILLLDSEGRVERGNRAACDCFALGAEELARRPLTDLVGSDLNERIRQALDAGGAELPEAVHLPGLAGVFSVGIWPRGDEHDGPSVLVLEDVSEKVRLREQLIHSEKLSALGELISGIAHELNNPLTAVLGYAQILEMKGDGKFAEELTHLRHESLRASRIVRNLLTFARRTEPRREPTDLNEILRQTVALRAYELRVRNIDVKEDLQATLPRSMMDRGQIQQVVLNLLNNAEHAIHATEDSGWIELTTRALDDRLVLTVTDSGPGVPAEAQDHIFHPFFTTKPVGQGTGLGLPICYGLIRDHGGEIRLDPEHRDGTRFVVELPVVTWQPDPERVDSAEPAEVAPPQDLRILFVDDEESIRALGREYLETLGHRVTVAVDGEEALAKLSESTFDAVVCDLLMPRSGGKRFYRRAVEANPGYRSKFAFLSGDSITPELATFTESIAAPLLTKPFELSDLARVVAKLVV